MRPLQTQRLLLRAWTPADTDFAFDMYSRWEVQRFIGTALRVMADRDEAEAAIARWRAPDDHPVHGVWAVQRRDGKTPGPLLGTVILKPVPSPSDQDPPRASGDAEIGWHLHPDAWGYGCATEAAAAVLTHAFCAGLAEVSALTLPANTASQAVARRIGMLHQGQTDRYYDTTCELFTATNPAP